MLSALGLCLLTTFEAFAARDGIEVRRWNADITGTAEASPEGLQFSSIVLCLAVELGGNIGGVDRTLEDAKQYCLVLNSLRVPVVIETTIRTPGHAEEPQRRAG